jgi:hypothetical protein
VEFLIRAFTLYGWYVTVVGLGLGVLLLGVLWIAPRVQKWRKRQWPTPGSPQK